MYQFTLEEIKRLRLRAKENGEIVEGLKEKVRVIYERELCVPKRGIANWKLYYYCPKHSVQLKFDLDKPYEHCCPVDGEVFTGEPYDSTWWGFVNQQNYLAAYHMGLIYLLTEDRSYSNKVKDLLMTYATYYPDYEVHGDIPYNHPGKSGAQALDEAIFIRHWACAYDFIEDTLTNQEKDFIKTRLLLEGATFLMGQRTEQLHNHEVIINSAIGVVGIIMERQDLIEFALYSKYGLKYQLEEGVLEDKLWFEGSVSYHFYALQSFLGYEKFAIHTPYSLIEHPNYRQMMEMVIDLLQPNYKFPLINDMHPGQDELNGYSLFEFIYKMFGDERILQVLNKVYESQPRKSMEAFFYGVEELGESSQLVLKEFHSEEGSGMTVLRGKEDSYLLVKHSPYGGEHDHYDRLAITYTSHGQRVLPDLGTTGYGAVLHYDYYKNTGTHNTVVINEENQAPASCKVREFIREEDYAYIDTSVTWEEDYKMPDSFTIKHWDEESYKNVTMRRKILWLEDYFIEVFTVEGAKKDAQIDWISHIPGNRRRVYDEESVLAFSDKKPFKHLKNVTRIEEQEKLTTEWDLKEGVAFKIVSYTKGITTYYGEGPDNPSIQDISYIIHRVSGSEAMYVNVYESYKGHSKVQDVNFKINEEDIHIIIEQHDGIQHTYKVSL